MWPEHTRNINTRQHTNQNTGITMNAWAQAPYNFIPLPEKVVAAVTSPNELPDHHRVAIDRYSGYFEVALETLSPLYIRCPQTATQFENGENNRYADGTPLPEDGNPEFRRLVKNLPDFYYTNQSGAPVIPGSSLRGMIRNVLEIVTWSKIKWVTGKRMFYRTLDTNTNLGKEYNTRMMVQSSGRNGDGYRTRVRGGFLRFLGKDRVWIEECLVLRVDEDKVAREFGQGGKRDLYTGNRPNDSFRWNYQQKQVWVRFEPQPQDHPHSQGRYLRYQEVTEIKTTSVPGHTPGILVLTGPAPRKHLAFVFVPIDNPRQVNIPNDPKDEDINQRLFDLFHDDDQLTQWQKSKFGKNQPKANVRKQNGYLCDGEPVFFLEENGQLVFFGRAQMFRLPYKNRPIDLVPESLCDPAIIDFAEALFGFLRTDKELQNLKERSLSIPAQGEKGFSYAGRIFVTDAKLLPAQTDLWLVSPDEPALVPGILSGPKPTSFQHYLVQKEDNPQRLRHYDSPSPRETVIRGHKRYWFKGDRTEEDLKAQPGSPGVNENGDVSAISSQHTQCRPLKSGKKFEFRIYFENLSKVELGALEWTICFPDSQYAHMLGMGKPFGMGAVRLTPVLALTHSPSSKGERYRSLFNGQTWYLPSIKWEEGKTPKQLFEAWIFEQITDADKEGATSFTEIPRIKMLLAMLKWEDPGKHIEYKSYQHPGDDGKTALDKFRWRPILPDPLNVLPPGQQKAASLASSSPPTHSLSNNDGVATPQVGDTITWSVDFIDGGDVYLGKGECPGVYARIKAALLEGKQYSVGNLARVIILEIRQEGVETILECKPAPKKR